MKKISSLLLALFSLITFAQLPAPNYPANYYSTATGTGATLKTQLSAIITAGHLDKGYNGLWTGYKTTDIDNFYEKDGTILDIYSENPSGADPYEFTVSTDQCGTYGVEGDCYNREHIVPQSLFNEASPMRNDINFIRPTDGKVNGMRSNYPFGKVGTPTFTSKNGSKLGKSVSSGYSGIVFEPIDAFKGDVARMVFYFVTRYENQLSTFSSGDMLGGSAYPGLQKWELDQLLAWAAADPVSPEEMARNNAAYTFQGNRNPYIDHPEYVNMVWGTQVADTQAPTAATNLTVTATTGSTANLSWTAATDNIGVTAYDIYVDGVLKTTVSGTATTATVSGLAANTTYSFYIIAKDAAGNVSPQSNTATGTTTNTPPPTNTTTCGTENFENIPASASSYATRTWTNNGITWIATDARTDQTINTKAITIRNGDLSSSTISGGVGSLTVTTQLKFSGSSGNLDIYLNGTKVGTVPYSTTATTTTLSNLNISGSTTIKLVNPVTDNRIAIDDLSWTCYTTTLGTIDISNSKKFMVYPNPVRNGEMFINGLTEKTDVQVYSISGQLVQTFKAVSDKQRLELKKLPKGVYLIKAGSQSAKIIVD